MKKNLKTLAVIFSVALNVVFAWSYLYHGKSGFYLANRQVEQDHPLYEELGLSRDQLDRCKPIRDRFQNFVEEQGRKFKARQLELVGLLAKEAPNRQAIDANQEEIRTLQQQMQARVIDHLLEESRFFTPEQRRMFFELIKERIMKSGGPRPRWMPGKQAIPSKGERR